MRLEKKVAVVTGAGGLFGRPIVVGMAKEGAVVYLQDFADQKDKLEQTAEAVRKAGGKVVAAIYDVTDPDEVAAMTKDILAKYDHIDVLVNTTAGGWHGKFFECAEADWNKAIDRGLKAYFLTCQLIGKEMARKGKGKIINLTSIVGNLGSSGAVPWGAARGGVNAMTFAIAQCLGEYGINVTALAHGMVANLNQPPEAQAERQRRLALGRLGDENDVVGPAVFLASDESQWVTGSVVYCEGGYVSAAATDAEHRVNERVYTGA